MRTNNAYFLVLDIETSTHEEYDERLKKEIPTAVWLAYGVCKLYTARAETVRRCYFREWDKLRNWLIDVGRCFGMNKTLCYVHNLSYEFDFVIKNLSHPLKFICNDSHKVIQATLQDFTNIEFRCSYQLTVKSLRQLGKELKFEKLEDDYSLILPSDDVPEEKWQYCIRDCDVVAKQISEECKEYTFLHNIPLTSTGRVRKIFKEFINQFQDERLWDLLPPENCYDALCKVFTGAITMSNPRFTNRIIHAKIRCFDEKSKYPGACLAYDYPYTVQKLDKFSTNEFSLHPFWIAKVRFVSLLNNYDWGCISLSKCTNYSSQTETFNGKVITSPYIEMYITNIDYSYITQVYNIQDTIIIEFYACDNYGKLPKAFTELIKAFAKPKYELKQKMKTLDENSDEYYEVEKEYMKSKNKLNSIYGMMVQKLMPQEFYIDENFVWHEYQKPYVYSRKRIGRNFLYGIFITSYSRRDLILNIIANCPNNFLYCDTDSIKYIDTGKPFIDINPTIPPDLNSLPYLKDFNRFEEEEPYDAFLTYGAKKYCYISKSKFHYVVAGLPRDTEKCKWTQPKSFSDFQLNTTFNDCKLAKRYIYNKQYMDIIEDEDYENYEISEIDFNTIRYLEENNIHTNGGIGLFTVNYKLNMTTQDLDYIRRHEIQWQNANMKQGIMISEI